jgi:23S rRNA (adenine2503-C2)-methyltransferase
LILDLDFEHLQEFVLESGEPSFRARQIWEWIFKKRTFDFQSMSNLPEKFRAVLRDSFSFPTLKRCSRSSDGTIKFLWALEDGELIESVLLPYFTSRKKWISLCLSTQAGCPVRCLFCQTGIGGFRRNLSRGEILFQVVGMEKFGGTKASRILFMGMGEPLLNLRETIGAVEVLTRKEGGEFGERRITLSTVGMRELEEFLRNGPRVEIAYSLHFPEENQRKRFIPHPHVLPISRALELLEEYHSASGRVVSIEYLMIKGINDSLDSASKLSSLLRGKPFHVNLLPFNPVSPSSFSPSPRGYILAFKNFLRKSGLNVTIRKPRGSDIQAACGQLRAQTLDGEDSSS